MLSYPKTININNTEFEVVLELKDKKNSSAIVSGDKIIVRLTDRISIKNQNDHLNFLLNSIKKKLVTSKRKREPYIIDLTKDIKLISGTYKYKLIFEERKDLTCKLVDNNIIRLNIPHNIPESLLEENIRKIFIFSLIKYNQEFINGYVKGINQKYFDYRIDKVELSYFKAKWGICRSDHTIKLNILLLFAPIEILEYIVVHELSHVGMFNHSKNFWHRVDKIIKNRKERESWLKIYGASLINFKMIY